MDIGEAIQHAVQNYQSGNLHQAEHFCKTILEKQPNNAEVLSFLGIIYIQLGDHDLAVQYLKKSLFLDSGNANAYLALGTVLQHKGRIEEAENAYKKVIHLDPSSAEAYSNLGRILKEKGQYDDAISCFSKAIYINPALVHAYHYLAGALVDTMRLDEAVKICNAILRRNASDVLAYYILGNIFMTQGQLDKAEECFKHVIREKPDELKSYQAFLMLLSYHTTYTAQAILREHLRFAEQFEKPLYAGIIHHTNECTLNRKLKIGYVSPDFRRHPVAHFIEPVLITHNRDLFEIYCYADVSAPDEITYRLKDYVHQWRNITCVPDDKVASLIRKEKIDILIDLAGHTGGVNRMALFARKPAPVQVSWIGYPATTGLSAMDYKIVDSYTDPPGLTDQYYTEKLIRMPETFLCYLPAKDSPDVTALPALTSGYITFGSFNNFVKVTPEVIRIWSRILKAVPTSHLILKSFSFLDKTTCTYAKNAFVHEGIQTERIELLQPVSSMRDHLSLYKEIDIGLDTFPYNGTTTTCEALWMGVPVITLAGSTHASRVGMSLLSNVGLPDFVATTPEDYIRLAEQLSEDTERLRSLREQLRDMMRYSPLTDARRFTGNLEEAYRKAWEAWCNVS